MEVEVEEEREEEEEDVEAEIVFINQPKSEAEMAGSLLEDERILPAVIVISVSVFILGVVGLYLLLHRRDDSGSSEVFTIVKLDTNQHYPHYNFVPDRERNIYQVKSVSSEESSHNYYQII